MAYPEPRNLDDIYGVGAEAAEAFSEALDKQSERALKAGVSPETILSVVTALADTAEKDVRHLKIGKLLGTLEKLQSGDFGGTPINKGSAAMMLIEGAIHDATL